MTVCLYLQHIYLCQVPDSLIITSQVLIKGGEARGRKGRGGKGRGEEGKQGKGRDRKHVVTVYVRKYLKIKKGNTRRYLLFFDLFEMIKRNVRYGFVY